MIHTIAYFNPIHARISNLKNSIMNTIENLNDKECSIKFGEFLASLDFSDIDNEMNNFKNSIMEILLCPFYEFGKEYPSIHDEKHFELFCQDIADSIIDVYNLREENMGFILSLSQFLKNRCEKWIKLSSRSSSDKNFRSLWLEGVAQIVDYFDENLGVLPRLLDKLLSINDAENDEFVELSNTAIIRIFTSSDALSLNMDKDFTKLEILYQEYQEKENSLLYEKIQTLLASGDDISEICSVWRETQANKVLDDFPAITNLVFENLKEKKLNENSLNNITSIIGGK